MMSLSSKDKLIEVLSFASEEEQLTKHCQASKKNEIYLTSAESKNGLIKKDNVDNFSDNMSSSSIISYDSSDDDEEAEDAEMHATVAPGPTERSHQISKKMIVFYEATGKYSLTHQNTTSFES